MCHSLSWIAKSIARRVRWDWQSAENSASLPLRHAFTSTVIPTGHSHGLRAQVFSLRKLSLISCLVTGFLMYICNAFFEYLAHKNTKAAAAVATTLKLIFDCLLRELFTVDFIFPSRVSEMGL